MGATLPLGVLLAACATFGLGQPPAASAQPPPEAKFIQVQFMKVVEGKGEEYSKLEQMWKPLNQDRVDKGQIESWSLYVVSMPPGSTTREYDAATVTVFGPFAKMEAPYDEAQIARIGTFPECERDSEVGPQRGLAPLSHGRLAALREQVRQRALPQGQARPAR